MNILVVEDETGLRENIVSYLTSEDNICESCDSFNQAIRRLTVSVYDCVLLDLGLPDGDGLNLLSFLKKNLRNEAIIIISAKSTIEEKIEGLNFGADDYIGKPFHLAELKARLMAVYRRKQTSFSHLMKYNELSIDIIRRSIHVNNVLLTLTKKEFDLVLYFVVNKEKIISKNAIAEHLWSEESDIHFNLDFIYTHIKNLRKKLTDAGCRDYIKTIYGIGYKFEGI